MNTPVPLLVSLLLVLLAAPAYGGEEKFGLGVGVNYGVTVESDSTASTFEEQGDTSGFTILGRYLFSNRWGLLLSYRVLEEDQEFDLENKYRQVGFNAVRMWRNDKAVRPYFKFGLTRTERERPIASEDGIGLSLGGGVEVGSKKLAFIGELESTGVQLGDETMGIASWTAGALFRF